MNVLLVAPDVGLPGAVQEVRVVSMALHPVILNGQVTRRDVLDALASHVWDVVWFATHGDENGIVLSDGAVSISDLTAIMRNSGAHLAVLNSCSSRYVGMEMWYELGIDVITTETAADDLSAFQVGALLARNLATGMSVEQAYERSKPGQDSTYRLFSSKEQGEAEQVRLIRMLNEWGRNIQSDMKQLQDEIEKVKDMIASQFAAVDRRQLVTETAVQVLQQRSSPMIDRVMTGLMTLIMLAMVFLTLYQQWWQP